MCGWTCRRDTGRSILDDNEEVTCGKCQRVWKQSDEFQVGRGGVGEGFACVRAGVRVVRT